MTTELIDSLRIERETLWVRPCSEFGSRYLSDDFWVAYDPSVDLDDMTEAVALMPYVLSVLPVVWASGDAWSVPELDSVQAERVEGARETLRAWYPGISWDGRLEADRTTSAPAATGDRDVILFSGGLDSTHSALRHPPGAILLLLRGLDIALDNGHGWARVLREARALAERAGHTLVTAETSMRRHLRKDVLDALDPTLHSWWGQVQHGLALAGLAAPVVASAGGGRVLIPSSLSRETAQPHGSAPELDEHASWSGGEVAHHDFDVTRHEKLRWVLERCEEIGPVYLRVCYSRPHGAGDNCLTCEKCLRTALALMIEGRDPLRFGLPLAPLEVELRVREGFENGEFEDIAALVPLWTELRERAHEHDGLLSDDFRRWFLSDPRAGFAGAALAR